MKKTKTQIKRGEVKKSCGILGQWQKVREATKRQGLGQFKVCILGQGKRQSRGTYIERLQTEAENMVGNVSYFHSVWLEGLLFP